METFPYPNKFSGLWECHCEDSCPEFRVQNSSFCIPSGAYRPGLIHTMLVNNERYSFCKFQQPLTERALEKYPELYEEWLKSNNQ